ncbi:hypothetical protein O4O00_23485 [Citrobacter sedlakii]|uniref:hypothetical protein n=1 Tax=Citrobacter sedlakii TaxID=67826 RepID=UPI0022B428E6|nr:hypothetical protein [Citrobacter sedlakii]MCZ4677299.1 hypothetical protein [Citrobacter sedlakii]MDR5007356.1 hypothetical protein [Citrobacter sedlakii]
MKRTMSHREKIAVVLITIASIMSISSINALAYTSIDAWTEGGSVDFSITGTTSEPKINLIQNINVKPKCTAGPESLANRFWKGWDLFGFGTYIKTGELRYSFENISMTVNSESMITSTSGPVP